MISVAAALDFIGKHRQDYGLELVPLEAAAGRILGLPVFADRDFPPFDRVAMDGIALAFNTYATGVQSFKIEGIQAAGQGQKRLQQAYHCLEVMTGAVLPQGTDTVIPYEDCQITDGVAKVTKETAKRFQNIHAQARDGRSGDLLIKNGERITPAVIGVLATVGQTQVTVQRLPSVAICATGDELVDVSETPLPHQIRKSNSYMLEAALKKEQIEAVKYQLTDEKGSMKNQLATILVEYDVILFSGAVSKGKYDFLPEVLGSFGMTTGFHRVAQKPGKPFLFGLLPNNALVFGFPGNPVSTMVCYKIFFQDWLYRSINHQPKTLTAILGEDVSFLPALTYHLLVQLSVQDGCVVAMPHAGSGSGDLLSITACDALLSLPPEESVFKKGGAYPITLL